MSLSDGQKVKIAVLGASGYTGAELVRLLALHPRAEIVALTADRKAGQAFADVFPHLGGLDLPDLVAVDDVDWSTVDFVFCGLPHGTTQEIIAALPQHIKVCDLSADFRLFDVALYETAYGAPHKAPALQKEAVYGLCEAPSGDISKARLVANPGCYPTAAQLPLLPLLKAGLIEIDDIIIDAKSGVSGAGRAAKEGSLHTEVSEGFHAYAVASHRHGPEIDQTLSQAAGQSVMASFTPHLLPMNRGILATTYVKLSPGKTAAEARAALEAAYADKPFVRVLPAGQAPHTRHVRGSNFCLISLHEDRRSGRLILISVIDNLVKGASGQALQNMNIMMGLPEDMGLMQQPLFP